MRDALIMGTTVVCADVGSTYTKVAVVDVAGGGLVATAAHPTTLAAGVGKGLEAAVAATGAATDEWYVCSSAGGGLRLAVVGYERLVTAEAGHRVGLSAGARVVHVAAGPLDGAGLRALRAARPDVLLLVGGTDGGDAETLTHNARRVGRARWRVPVVVAGNADAAADVRDALPDAVVTDNVLPRIGVLNPGPARAAIREVFLRHVIGGRWGGRFARLVRAATPDAVLAAVELLADDTGGGLVVVDVGGATTDVYSALPPGAEQAAEAAGVLARARTVEGDLGVRWNAPGILRAAAAERIPHSGLATAADERAADPGLVAGDGTDLELARIAATVALRRHARGEPTGRGRRDLRDVRLVVGSGGPLRHAPPGRAVRVLADVLGDHGGGWPVPRAATTVVDTDYVLAAAGLLAAPYPDASIMRRCAARRHAEVVDSPPGRARTVLGSNYGRRLLFASSLRPWASLTRSRGRGSAGRREPAGIRCTGRGEPAASRQRRGVGSQCSPRRSEGRGGSAAAPTGEDFGHRGVLPKGRPDFPSPARGTVSG